MTVNDGVPGRRGAEIVFEEIRLTHHRHGGRWRPAVIRRMKSKVIPGAGPSHWSPHITVTSAPPTPPHQPGAAPQGNSRGGRAAPPPPALACAAHQDLEQVRPNPLPSLQTRRQARAPPPRPGQPGARGSASWAAAGSVGPGEHRPHQLFHRDNFPWTRPPRAPAGPRGGAHRTRAWKLRGPARGQTSGPRGPRGTGRLVCSLDPLGCQGEAMGPEGQARPGPWAPTPASTQVRPADGDRHSLTL